MSVLFFSEQKGKIMRLVTAQNLQFQLKELIQQLRQNKENVFREVDGMIPAVTSFLSDFLSEEKEWGADGIDIVVDDVNQQIRNFEEAYINKDIVMMADTFEYEIMNTMELYIKIKRNLENGKTV